MRMNFFQDLDARKRARYKNKAWLSRSLMHSVLRSFECSPRLSFLMPAKPFTFICGDDDYLVSEKGRAWFVEQTKDLMDDL